MPTDEKEPLQKPNGDMPDEIRALFKTCEQKQKAMRRADIDKLREVLIQELSFARSQFPRRPEGEFHRRMFFPGPDICIRRWSSS